MYHWLVNIWLAWYFSLVRHSMSFQWKCKNMMTNTTMTASIMMVRLTASTSKSSFMMRLPQALRLLRLFKVEPSRSPSLLHHLRNHHRPHNHWDKKVSLHCPAFCQIHNRQHRQQPLSSIMMVTFCEAPAAQDLFGEGTTAPPRNPVFHLYFPVSFKMRNGLKHCQRHNGPRNWPRDLD